MNWEAAAAIGEILGAAAVLVTLVYLTVQVRQTTASVAALTYDTVMTGFNQINLAIAETEEIASIMDRGFYEPETLSKPDGVRFSFVMRSAANQYLKLLRLYERGALPRREWEIIATEAAQVFRTPGGAIFRSEHANYRDLFFALDRLVPEKATAFRFGEGGVDNASIPD